MTQPSANDLLMGGGVKSAKFDTVGTTVGGQIVRPPQARQQTDFDSGKPKFYDNGDPMMQIVVHVATPLRDPADPNDDGVRAIYVRGQMTQAVREAVRGAGGPGLEVGGELYVTFTGTEKNSRGRGQDKKVYAARYTVPSAQAANAALMGAPAPAAPQYAPGFAPQPPFGQPAAQPAWHGDPATNPANTWGQPVQAAPAPVAQPTADIPAPPGVDAAAWAQLPADKKQQYLALMPR